MTGPIAGAGAGAGVRVAEPEGELDVSDLDRIGGDGTDEVRMVLPARPRFLRVARLTAASLAADMGVDLEGVEDLRVAIDELSAALIADAPAGATLELAFRLGGGRLAVEGAVPGRWDGPFTLHPVATALLDIVAHEYAIDQTDAGRTFRLVVEARADAAEA